MFPTVGKEIPAGYNGWMIFLDELPSASRATQAASYKLLLDRMIGGHQLHPNVVIAAAGNLASDKAIVNPLSTASQSRMVHLELQADYKDWLRFVAIPENYDSRIIGYLSQYENKLMAFDPNHQEFTFPCPRTWEFVNKLIGVEGTTVESQDIPLFAGTIGASTATDFVAFCQVYKDLISNEQIQQDPENCPVPEKVAAKWALITRLCDNGLKPEFIQAYVTYVERFPRQFQILFLRMMMTRFPQAASNPVMQKFSIGLAQYLWD